MIIESQSELVQLQEIGKIVAETLHQMLLYVKPGITTKELDEYGGRYLEAQGARSAPKLTYNFPGYSCISVNEVVAHGIPSEKQVLQEGDVINIDVSAERQGFWADNGASIIVGQDLHNQRKLVNSSFQILNGAIKRAKSGVRINLIGDYIERSAKASNFKIIKNLGGHGIGRALHEEPTDILNFRDQDDKRRLRKGSVIAIETFLNTRSSLAIDQSDGFTLIGNKGGIAVQHEMTIVVTDNAPIVVTPPLYTDLL
ncbi:type I methionyl aminopeptidase [Sphingobacterium sp. LRF_L2]|uniref:type I methionyl aminopeptidase n=1 Tax=Sphingobacterium sp. LRF_L2 TaxID=3369421 RepID=UPI003F6123D7